MHLPYRHGRIPHEDFDDFDHYRWNREEGYKLFKCRAEVEEFSGKTATAVKQDFHTKIFLMTLAVYYAFPIEEKVREEYLTDEQRKYDKKNQQDQHAGHDQGHIDWNVCEKRVSTGFGGIRPDRL